MNKKTRKFYPKMKSITSMTRLFFNSACIIASICFLLNDIAYAKDKLRPSLMFNKIKKEHSATLSITEGAGYRPSRAFGETGLRFFPLGIGTAWFGRPWPTDNVSYTDPSPEDIEQHLDQAFEIMANGEGIVMIDAAAAYGYTEERIGTYFKKKPDLLRKAFISTKWGEDFDLSNGKSSHNYSAAHLIFSVDRSLKNLGKIDLLYMHGTGERNKVLGALQDGGVIKEMKDMKTSRNIKYLGVSISNADILEVALEKDLLKDFEAVQISIEIYLLRPELVDRLFEQGKAIVVNSPIRKGKKILPDKSEREIYELLLEDYRVITLTGTRHHLKETAGYVEASEDRLAELTRIRQWL